MSDLFNVEFKKNSTMKNYAKLFKTSMALLMLGGLLVAPDLSAQNKLNTLKFDKTSQLRDFLAIKETERYWLAVIVEDTRWVMRRTV